jgi:phage shock protein A
LLATELAGLRQTIQSEEQQVTEQQQEVDKLAQAVAATNTEESKAKVKLGQLRSESAGAKAKEHAAAALEAVGDAVTAGGAVDSALDRVGRKSARADAAFERAIGTLPNQAENAAAADAILAELTATPAPAAT